MPEQRNESSAATTESRCACGHTDDWHSHEGRGDCEHDGECECRSFAALSTIQCAAYIGRAHGRCPNMGLRQHDELIDADGTGRMVWVSWCAFHKRCDAVNAYFGVDGSKTYGEAIS